MSNKYIVNESNNAGRIRAAIERSARQVTGLTTRKPGESDYDAIVRRQRETAAQNKAAIEAAQQARRNHRERMSNVFKEAWERDTKKVGDSGAPSKPASTDSTELTPKQAHVKRMQVDAYAAGWGSPNDGE